MPKLNRVKKKRTTKIGNGKKISLRSRAQIKRNTYCVLIYTDKGEKLKYRIPSRRGIHRISENDGVSYTHIKLTGNLRLNSRIALYSQDGVVNGVIKRITASGPSTDVDAGDTPPIRRPGGH